MGPDHDPLAYGAGIADDYDDLYEDVLDTETAIACLADLTGGGGLLELGIGTGRLALPLARLGLRVQGIEASEAMVAKLRAKPGGGDVPVEVGDFSDAFVGADFSIVLLAFNTIFALPDQDAQVRCFENAAAHLVAGGRFVVEAWVPDLTGFTDGQRVRPRLVSGDRVALVIAELDPVDQRMRTTQIELSDGGVRLRPATHRYAWPAELDLMARLAGLSLEHRWSGWDRQPFTSHSTDHVSVYVNGG